MNAQTRRLLPLVALLALVIVMFVSAGLLAAGGASLQAPVPTLVPPTLVPHAPSGMTDALPSESTLARIVADDKVRVGILYNEPQFGELNIRGDVSGFDADLARALAETWAVEVEFVQVTRQTAVDMLISGAVDLLIAAQPHIRGLDSRVEYSQSYFPASQVMAVRDDDGATVLGHMEGRKIGVVMGTRGEQAVSDWLNRSGITVTVERFVNLDQALSALLTSAVDGVVESRVRLARAFPEAGTVRLLDEPVWAEPYAVVLRRQDVNLRNLVNKTLQFLATSGKLNEIHQTHFSGANYPGENLTIWSALGEDAPNPAQFSTDIPFPAQYTVPRIQEQHVIRVAGVADLPDDADESQRRLKEANEALIEAMAARWGARVEYIPNSRDNALELVAGGQADIAIGVEPTWEWVDRVDFSQHYLVHGDRLMVLKDTDIEGFSGLRTDWIAYFDAEPGAKDRINELAEAANIILGGIFTLYNEEDAAFGMTAQSNYDAVFGDSLRLIPHVQANPDTLRLTTGGDNGGWYSRHYIAMAVPRNDLDFRLLVNYTLQELARDGTLESLLQPVMLPDEVPTPEIWPGSSDYLGMHLAG